MRGLWLIALMSLVLTPLLWSQRGGGHAGGGSMGHAGVAVHSGFASHAPVMASHGFSTGGNFNSNLHFNQGFHNPGFSHHGFGHHRFFFTTWPWYWTYGYPVYYYPWYSWDNGYSSVMDSNQYPAQSQNDYSEESNAQQAEIDRLEDEVQRLREEREARAAQSQAPAKPETHEPTILIFNDKHTQEVQNYGIVGETLWVFTEQRAVKIPLSSIDIDATIKANDARGLPFVVPELSQ